MSKNFFTALKEATRNILSKPNTVMFPAEQVDLPADIRGTPKVDKEKCTVCKRCERVCPTDAIVIKEMENKKYLFTIDLGKCCYCQECQDSCNFDAIALSSDIMTSSFTREPLIREEIVIKE